MTDSTVDPAEFSGIVAAHLHAETSERERNIRRTIAAIAVILLHIAAVSVFIYSVHIPVIDRIRTTVPEAIWILMPPKPKAPPRPVLETPPVPDVFVPTLTAPITLPPIQHRPASPPTTGTLEDIGRALACGASSYEYLTQAQREGCRRRPWDYVRKPDGTIVLRGPDKPPPPPAFTGGDLMRHEQQTAPPCPMLQNVPCLSKVLPNHDPVTNGSLSQ